MTAFSVLTFSGSGRPLDAEFVRFGYSPFRAAWDQASFYGGEAVAVYDLTDPAAPRLVAVRDVDACEAMERFFEWMQWIQDVENGDAR